MGGSTREVEEGGEMKLSFRKGWSVFAASALLSIAGIGPVTNAFADDTPPAEPVNIVKTEPAPEPAKTDPAPEPEKAEPTPVKSEPAPEPAKTDGAKVVTPQTYFDWNWKYDDPTCPVGLEVKYPKDIPAGSDHKDVNIRVKDLVSGTVKTFNFHDSDFKTSGKTVVYDVTKHKDWPGWTWYEYQWTQVHGTNYHWSGSVKCGEKPQPEEKKVYVCEYKGTPGVNEELKSGKQPIEVSVNTLKGFDGTFPWPFPDAQGRSVAIGYAGYGYPVKTVADCPPPDQPPYVPPTPKPVTYAQFTCKALGTITVPEATDVVYMITTDQAGGAKSRIQAGTWYATSDRTATGAPFYGTVTVEAWDPNNPAGATLLDSWSYNFTEPKDCTPPPPTNQCVAGRGDTSTNLNDLWSNVDTRAKGHVEYVPGGLKVWTEDSSSQSKVSEGRALAFDLKNTGVLSIDYTANFGIEPGINLFVDFGPDGTGILVYEKIYGQDLWLANSSSAAVKANAPVNGGGNGSQWHGTINQWLEKYPDAKVTGVAYSLGSGVHAEGVIHSITVNCTTYKFDYVAPPKPAKPTVTATCLACSQQGQSDGAVKVTVTNTDDVSNQTVEYTVALGGVEKKVTVKDGESSDVEFNGLAAGDYTVTVTGDDKTSAETSVTVKDCPLPPKPAGESSFSYTCEALTVNAPTGVQPEGAEYVYKLNGSPIDVGVRPLVPGEYVLTLEVNGVQVDSDTFKVEACPLVQVVPDSPTKVDRCEPKDGTVVDGVNIPASNKGHYTLDGKPVSAGFSPVAGTLAKVAFVPNDGNVVKEGAASEWTFTFTKEKCYVPPVDEPKRPTTVDTDNGPIVSQFNWPAAGFGLALMGVAALIGLVTGRRREV